MIINCNDLWTRFVGVIFRIRRKPMITNTPPPRPATRRSTSGRNTRARPSK